MDAGFWCRSRRPSNGIDLGSCGRRWLLLCVLQVCALQVCPVQVCASAATTDGLLRLELESEPLYQGRTLVTVTFDSAGADGRAPATIELAVDGDVQQKVRVNASIDGRASARLRLPSLPERCVVTATGYNSTGDVVGFDRRLLNAGYGDFSIRVRELSESPGSSDGERRLQLEVDQPASEPWPKIEVSSSGLPLASLEQPPWQADVTLPVPANPDLPSILTIRAERADGRRFETAVVAEAVDDVQFREDVSLVELYGVFRDRRGRLVDDLEVGDVTIREAGRELALDALSPARDVPLTVVLTIDVSRSMRSRLAQVRNAALRFSRNLRPQDRALLVSFSGAPTLELGPTSKPEEVERALDKVVAFAHSPAGRRGGTAIWDAMVYSLVQLRGVKGRRAVVLLTDGDDRGSNLALHQADVLVRRAGVPIYLIDLDAEDLDGSDYGVASASLSTAASRAAAQRARIWRTVERSGGRVLEVRDDLTAEGFESDGVVIQRVYDQVAEELRAQYLLSFTPPSGSKAGWRPLDVGVSRAGVTLRTARGRWQP